MDESDVWPCDRASGDHVVCSVSRDITHGCASKNGTDVRKGKHASMHTHTHTQTGRDRLMDGSTWPVTMRPLSVQRNARQLFLLDLDSDSFCLHAQLIAAFSLRTVCGAAPEICIRDLQLSRPVGSRGEAPIGSLGDEVSQKLKQFAVTVYRFWPQKRSKSENVAQFTSWLLTSLFHYDIWGLIASTAPTWSSHCLSKKLFKATNSCAPLSFKPFMCANSH